jgi:mRNA-degrading endonuclease toxin of MazEF toxin-antitoxin module
MEHFVLLEPLFRSKGSIAVAAGVTGTTIGAKRKIEVPAGETGATISCEAKNSGPRRRNWNHYSGRREK